MNGYDLKPFAIGERYRDTETGHHVLFLYGPLTEHGVRNPEWGYTVTAEPGGAISDEIGTERWEGLGRSWRYEQLEDDPSTVAAELRNVVAALHDEVDPNDIDGEWSADRLPTLALAAVTLFQKIDDHLQHGGALPLEWNPYVALCGERHAGCDAYNSHPHCGCRRKLCDGHHRCGACGHTWETQQG